MGIIVLTSTVTPSFQTACPVTQQLADESGFLKTLTSAVTRKKIRILENPPFFAAFSLGIKSQAEHVDFKHDSG